MIAVGFKQLHSHSKIKVFFTTGDHRSPQLIYSFPEFKYTLPFSVHNHFDEWTWLFMKFVRKCTRSFTVYCLQVEHLDRGSGFFSFSTNHLQATRSSTHVIWLQDFWSFSLWDFNIGYSLRVRAVIAGSKNVYVPFWVMTLKLLISDASDNYPTVKAWSDLDLSTDY